MITHTWTSSLNGIDHVKTKTYKFTLQPPDYHDEGPSIEPDEENKIAEPADALTDVGGEDRNLEPVGSLTSEIRIEAGPTNVGPTNVGHTNVGPINDVPPRQTRKRPHVNYTGQDKSQKRQGTSPSKVSKMKASASFIPATTPNVSIASSSLQDSTTLTSTTEAVVPLNPTDFEAGDYDAGEFYAYDTPATSQQASSSSELPHGAGHRSHETIAAPETEIEALRKMVRSLETMVQQLILQQLQQLQERDQQLQERDQQLQERDQQLQERDNIIAGWEERFLQFEKGSRGL